jgi:predicted DNA-binding protein (UPF0251 family)
MNASSGNEQSALRLVDIVELKWMLAGEGLHVHVEKLQSDPGYARECLLAAERSGNQTVRQVAATLRARLEASAATPHR